MKTEKVNWKIVGHLCTHGAQLLLLKDRIMLYTRLEVKSKKLAHWGPHLKR